jgi:hypothetical protein
MSPAKLFLATDRSRIDWIQQLEQYKAAFDIYDNSGDGSIQRHELEHVLARLTFDGGTSDGRACSCKACTEWSQSTAVTRVDWDAFHRQFDAHLTRTALANWNSVRFRYDLNAHATF